MEDVLQIIDAKYLHDYVVHLKFSTNEEFDLDLLPMIKEDKVGIFDSLKQLDFFSKFYLDYTLCWGNDIDVAPEYLLFLAHRYNAEYQTLFKKWGYI